MTLSDQLLIAAINKGICKEHLNVWQQKSVPEFIEYYKSMPDWCLERDFPGLDILRTHFDSPGVQAQGVYVGQRDLDIQFTKPEGIPILVFNDCSGVIRIKGWSVAKIYVSLSSNIRFIVEDKAILSLEYFDDAKIVIENHTVRPCWVYKYGARRPELKRGNIKLVDNHAKSV
jgi:hypothetical protein